MDEQSPQKTTDYAGKNLVIFSAMISFLLGVTITVFFVNFNPKPVSNDDGNKNPQKSEDYEIPLEVELQALYNFSDIKAQLISLDEEIAKEAEDRISKQKQGSDDTNDYQKFTDPSFRYTRLKKVLELEIDISNIKPEIEIKKDEIKKIIKAIYVFQIRFLDKDQFQKFANGQINQNTKNEIIRRVLDQDSNPVTQSKISPQINKSASDVKIGEEYRLAVIRQVQRYAMNFYDQKCYENWQMLGDATKDRYNNDQLNYAKYCLHNDKISTNKANLKVKSEDPSKEGKDKKVYRLIPDFKRRESTKSETIKLCATSFNIWKDKGTIELDITTEEYCSD